MIWAEENRGIIPYFDRPICEDICVDLEYLEAGRKSIHPRRSGCPRGRDADGDGGILVLQIKALLFELHES